jgi:biopolymer transport protein ExbD
VSLLSAQQDADVMAEINITPFTDVLLVLLIIFMILAAIVVPPGFEKELPNTNPSNTPTNNQKHDIEVDVNNKGVIFVNGEKADQNSIYYVMSQTVRKMGHKHVSIVADAKAPYGVIVRILDAAKIAGLEDVGFVTGG